MDNRTTGTATRAARELSVPLVLIDPRAAAEQLRSEPAWQQESRASVTLQHDGPMRVVLTSLHQDATIGPETSDDWTSIEVVEGAARVERDKDQTEARQGQRVVLSPASGWSLTALEEPTLVLCTFAPDR